MAYNALPFKRSGPDHWMVYEGNGRIVERDMTQAHAITLANVLNATLRAAQRARQRDRQPPQST
jgi:YD repeat-containing protein